MTYINPTGEKSLQCVLQDRGAKIFLAIFITLSLLIIILFVVILFIKKRKKDYNINKKIENINKGESNDIENLNNPKNISGKKYPNNKSKIMNSHNHGFKKEDKSFNLKLNSNSAKVVKQENEQMNTHYNSSNLESRIQSDYGELQYKNNKKIGISNNEEHEESEIQDGFYKNNKNFHSSRSKFDTENSKRNLNSSQISAKNKRQSSFKKISDGIEDMILTPKMKLPPKENKIYKRSSANLTNTENIIISRKVTENSYMLTNDNLICEDKFNILDLKTQKNSTKSIHNKNVEFSPKKKSNLPKFTKFANNKKIDNSKNKNDSN